MSTLSVTILAAIASFLTGLVLNTYSRKTSLAVANIELVRERYFELSTILAQLRVDLEPFTVPDGYEFANRSPWSSWGPMQMRDSLSRRFEPLRCWLGTKTVAQVDRLLAQLSNCCSVRLSLAACVEATSEEISEIDPAGTVCQLSDSILKAIETIQLQIKLDMGIEGTVGLISSTGNRRLR